MSSKPIMRREIASFNIALKCGQKKVPFIIEQIIHEKQNSFIHQNELYKWDSLSFTTIWGSSGISLPEFFCVKHPNRILWWGIAASFEEKYVLMVVYFNAEMDCIVHACYLIQLHKPTFLTPSLYVTDRDTYKSFARLRVEDNHFNGQKIKANRFEIVSKINDLEMVVHLSNDNGETWTRYKLTFNRETMTPALTLIPSDQKP